MKFCGNCGWEMKPLKVGITVETHAKIGPYEKYAADLIQCIQCGNKVIITGTGSVAVKGHTSYDALKTDRNVYYSELFRNWMNGELDLIPPHVPDDTNLAENLGGRETLIEEYSTFPAAPTVDMSDTKGWPKPDHHQQMCDKCGGVDGQHFDDCDYAST